MAGTVSWTQLDPLSLPVLRRDDAVSKRLEWVVTASPLIERHETGSDERDVGDAIDGAQLAEGVEDEDIVVRRCCCALSRRRPDRLAWARQRRCTGAGSSA